MRRWRWVAFGVLAGALSILERRHPLRARREPDAEHVGRNLVIGMLGAGAAVAGELPIVAPAVRLAARKRLGLLRWLGLPKALRVVLGFLLLDYTLYRWHRMNHEVPFLWRFHSVHHIDRDLDASTGIRFHFGELALASGFRAAQVLLIGVDGGTLRIFQHCLLASVMFHHSNVELPPDAEARLQLAVVTPRMHGIHHATRLDWMNTNYSSLLSVWDRIHSSLRLDVAQAAVTIGVEGYQRAEDVTLDRSLALPFHA